MGNAKAIGPRRRREEKEATSIPLFRVSIGVRQEGTGRGMDPEYYPIGMEVSFPVSQQGSDATIRLRVQATGQGGVPDRPREVDAPEGMLLWIEDGVDPLGEPRALIGIGEAQ
jgi:hypothetical protein